MRKSVSFALHQPNVVQCPSFDARNILRVSYGLALSVESGFGEHGDPLFVVQPVSFVPAAPERTGVLLAPQQAVSGRRC